MRLNNSHWRQRLSAALAGLLLVCGGAMAQEEKQNTFTLDAQLRTRGEYNHGAITPRNEGEGGALFATERARLSMGYQRKWLELKLSAQHTGVWGQDGINERAGRVALNEAWARLHFGNYFFAQVGRQQLSYDDERIFGTLDWNVAGNWHDALRIGYQQNATTAHLILAVNQNKENVRNHYYQAGMPYKTMLTLWGHHELKHEFSKVPLGISLLAMDISHEAGTEERPLTRHMQTFGTHLTYDYEGLDAALSFYFQSGKDVAGTKVSAFMASFQGSYKIDPVYTVRAGYDYLSGNDGRNINQHAFSTLYGTHHKFLGAMDYFTSNTPLGLQDIQLGASTSLFLPVNVSLDYHYFMTAEKVAGISKGLGHEVDIKLSCEPLKDVTLSAGYSFMLGTESMDVVKGGNHKSWQDWAWLSLNVSPRIFSSKW